VSDQDKLAHDVMNRNDPNLRREPYDDCVRVRDVATPLVADSTRHESRRKGLRGILTRLDFQATRSRFPLAHVDARMP
jgi:hypothetical protein